MLALDDVRSEEEEKDAPPRDIKSSFAAVEAGFLLLIGDLVDFLPKSSALRSSCRVFEDFLFLVV